MMDIIKVTLAVGNAQEVTIETNTSILYQTKKQSDIDINAAVNKHNTDPDAHSAIMAGVKQQVTTAIADLKKQAQTVSDNVNKTIAKIDVPAAISLHNTAPDAHNDIRQLITAKIGAIDLSPYAQTTQVTQSISTHNSDSDAHSDIRNLIARNANTSRSPVFTSILDTSRSGRNYVRCPQRQYNVGAVMSGDIYLTQNYLNFDYLVVINCDDSINVVGASMIPVHTFNFLMKNVNIVSITNLYNWYIWSRTSGRSTTTHWAIQGENCGIVDIIGIRC